MPRPGPRPYECVRRAWHSDRHQPMRGSLIQEVFRIVNEIHSIATKKNKEWLEKLPIVVLKAEEIMYSKANSEAEYMDLNTLWDRANDAINTIIRLDESTETGDLLQPCIEAALNLGCTPRRASRSQRNATPTRYLSPATHEPSTFSPAPMHNSNNLPMIGYLDHMGTKSRAFGCQKNDVSSNSLQCTTNNFTVPRSSNGIVADHRMLGLWSVYPMFHESCLDASAPSTSLPPRVGVSRTLFCAEGPSVNIGQAHCEDSAVKCCAVDCDLSLRLGSLPAPSQIVENNQLRDFKDLSTKCSFDKENKTKDRIPPMNKNIPLFPWANVNDQFDSVDAASKKRKAVFPDNLKDQSSRWQSKLPCNHSTGRMKSSKS